MSRQYGPGTFTEAVRYENRLSFVHAIYRAMQAEKVQHLGATSLLRTPGESPGFRTPPERVGCGEGLSYLLIDG